jgi:hypothetical protein
MLLVGDTVLISGVTEVDGMSIVGDGEVTIVGAVVFSSGIITVDGKSMAGDDGLIVGLIKFVVGNNTVIPKAVLRPSPKIIAKNNFNFKINPIFIISV